MLYHPGFKPGINESINSGFVFAKPLLKGAVEAGRGATPARKAHKQTIPVDVFRNFSPMREDTDKLQQLEPAAFKVRGQAHILRSIQDMHPHTSQHIHALHGLSSGGLS